MDRLTGYGWPGNVSELKSVIRQLVVRGGDGRIREHHLQGLLPSVDEELPLERHSLEELVRAKLKGFLNRIRGYRIEGLHAEVMARVERPLIELVLEQTRGNQLQAAKILGMNRNTLRKKIRAHGIRRIHYPENPNPN
jgi:two-component system nitrogen regulation response regulator GlnG